ncbi:MAG: hypothetical protein ACK5WB_00285 [Phycisphaerales bacterium]|jgi:hypothetical protein|nr:hypothetical protein [Phycisphaeraceae bacterium]MTA11655.1 hypothetical protein [Actinomycetota bacterium]
MSLPFNSVTIASGATNEVFNGDFGAPYRSVLVTCEFASPTAVEVNAPEIHGATWHKVSPGTSVEFRKERELGTGGKLAGLKTLRLRAVGGNAIASVIPTE